MTSIYQRNWRLKGLLLVHFLCTSEGESCLAECVNATEHSTNLQRTNNPEHNKKSKKMDYVAVALS